MNSQLTASEKDSELSQNPIVGQKSSQPLFPPVPSAQGLEAQQGLVYTVWIKSLPLYHRTEFLFLYFVD